jgi:hypothetical protein
MAECPVCGDLNAYKGLKEVECNNASCRLYKKPTTTIYVCWKVNGREGRCKASTLKEAKRKVDQGLANYGKGSHWIERE